jgi:hypothetical protein
LTIKLINDNDDDIDDNDDDIDDNCGDYDENDGDFDDNDGDYDNDDVFKLIGNPDEKLEDGVGNRIPLISSRKNSNSAKKMLKKLSKLVKKLREI